MASSSDSDWAGYELVAIYELIHKDPDFDAAIERVVGNYSGMALKRLYEVTLRWGPTYAKRANGLERAKRTKLVNYILRGTAHKRKNIA